MERLQIYVSMIFLLSMYTYTINAQTPLFPNSVVSNDIDYIFESDPDSFVGNIFLGREDRETPGAPDGSSLFDVDTYIFEANFTDGETIEIWCHSSFESQDAAQEFADKLGPRLGKLPIFQRNMLNHVVIHNGDGGAFAEIEGQFFILYSENMDARISTNDLEETVFHESVHSSYQFMYQNHPDWLAAQAADLSFVTTFGENNPTLEDIAESALFAYTYLTYPGRLDESIETWLEENNANRLEFFGKFYGQTTNVSEVDLLQDLRISPNPSRGKFTLHSDGVLNGVVNIISLDGTILNSLRVDKESEYTIDLSSYENGLYLISIPGYKDAKVLKY